MAHDINHFYTRARWNDYKHGCNKVTPLSRAAIAVGADGLMVEVHCDPDHALSDGAQSLYPDQLDELLAQVRQIAPVVGRSLTAKPTPIPVTIP